MMYHYRRWVPPVRWGRGLSFALEPHSFVGKNGKHSPRIAVQAETLTTASSVGTECHTPGRMTANQMEGITLPGARDEF